VQRGGIQPLHVDIEPLINRRSPETPLTSHLDRGQITAFLEPVDRALGELQVFRQLFRAQKIWHTNVRLQKRP
jgi:hypothetical protein